MLNIFVLINTKVLKNIPSYVRRDIDLIALEIREG
jgi:hypothetical protein